jgi:glyoxylase-like metal-dependent hydrolase (beta-lactamase superfamily II)
VEITKGIRRIGTGMVNVYLVEEAGSVTIVDAGLPGYWKHLPGELAAMGRSLGDVRAVILTHAHSDHVGFAEQIRKERSVPVRVHEADAKLARGEVKVTGQKLRPLRLLPTLRFFAFGLRNGLGVNPIREVTTFDDGATLDVPGAPRVIHLPGHTEGSVAFHMAGSGSGALFIGDGIATLNVMTGITGPQISPFTADIAKARASLAALDGVVAGFVLPGHGDAWTGGVAEAVNLARSA